ncbi:MAG: hypothetical protein HYV17_07615 [Xanthomonadales bacterium]|nr:hypothetical protein [Xanthomonadales bacterium]
MRSRTWLAALLMSFVACTTPAAAELPAAPAGAPLVVCYPGNSIDKSSDGCPCLGNNECMGVCSGGFCGAVTNASYCAPVGNGLDRSADGCECNGNNDCIGVCGGASGHECGGATPDPDPPVCSLGNAYDLSDDGCPCALNNECASVCGFFTRTCANVVGAVLANPPAISGVAASPVQIGANTIDQATLSGAMFPSGRIEFRLYSPADSNCSFSAAYTGSTAISANGNYLSGTYAANQLGTWRWVAIYHGNAYNLSAQTACANANQHTLVIDDLFHDGFE